MGEHLEELRRRIIYGLIGTAVAAGGCLLFGNQLFKLFCQPLVNELHKNGLSTQLYYMELGEPFMVYIKISLICAACIASPWILYQLWQFVAAGLYPKERKYITKYVPLSIGLVISGMAFVYWIVLPWTIAFFLVFGDAIPAAGPGGRAGRDVAPGRRPAGVPGPQGGPGQPAAGQRLVQPARGSAQDVHRRHRRPRRHPRGAVRAQQPAQPARVVAGVHRPGADDAADVRPVLPVAAGRADAGADRHRPDRDHAGPAGGTSTSAWPSWPRA